MRAGFTFVPVLAAFLAVPLLAGAGHHEAGEAKPEPKAWDQARVAELAGDLSKGAEEMRQAVRQQAGATESIATQSRATENLMDELRGLRVECNRLRKEVESGKGRDDTVRTFKRVDEIHRNTAEELRRLFLSEANLARVKKERALLEELRLYYTGEVDTRPDLVGPKRDEKKS